MEDDLAVFPLRAEFQSWLHAGKEATVTKI